MRETLICAPRTPSHPFPHLSPHPSPSPNPTPLPSSSSPSLPPSLAFFRRLLRHSTPPPPSSSRSSPFPALLAVIPFAVAALTLARTLLSACMAPRSVLVLDSLQPPNFRGSLSSDDTLTFKLESSAKRKRVEAEKMLLRVPYYPSGSVVDGFGAAILALPGAQREVMLFLFQIRVSS
ncbi:serine/threonine-protein kinase WNK4-like [Cajanus cajan]|uniref:serine/threonine-protein kinase WNK4-like n=1 Tax=Cajanus cajan TaxID=3821 RepID=UPI0010FAE77C|nr:serine/threonine-protein kinase WNK4-like [Cajanus cajan]